jgi:hypothetical protein
MNWFNKFAKDFSDRNTVNKKIRYLKEVKQTLNYLGKLVFQSGTIAKNKNYKIISSATITSYPTLHRILMEADELALDNPWEFARLCKDADIKIDCLLYALKKEKDYITYGGPKGTIVKGLV